MKTPMKWLLRRTRMRLGTPVAQAHAHASVRSEQGSQEEQMGVWLMS